MISAWALHSKRKRYSRILVSILLLVAVDSFGDTTYVTPDDFLRQTFNEVPQPSLLWLDNSAQTQLSAVLGHRYPQARMHYWRLAHRTAWILDEVGKEYPITAGFVIDNDRIERADVLIFRESRGSEIHLPAFLRQFVDARLEGDGTDGEKLSKNIDGITGATLSVNAMRRMAQAALVLNRLAP